MSVKSHHSVLLGPHMDAYKRLQFRIPKNSRLQNGKKNSRGLVHQKIIIHEPVVVGKIVVLDNMSHVVTNRKSGQNHQDPVTYSYMSMLVSPLYSQQALRCLVIITVVILLTRVTTPCVTWSTQCSYMINTMRHVHKTSKIIYEHNYVLHTHTHTHIRGHTERM